MKHAVFLFLILIQALAACSITPEPSEPGINTDPIAGYWSGQVEGELDAGDELPPREIGILIIAGCTVGKVCGKFSEGGQCPGDIILIEADGNQYKFLSETASGTRHICGKGNNRMIDLELRPDGTLNFVYHNGATLIGILVRK